MFRSIATIAFAIRFGHPDVTAEDATRYAVALQGEAVQNEFDPLTGVAIIRRESQFHPRAVSRDGEDYGLAQVRARHIGACKKDRNPRSRPSEACRAVKESLLDPDENIRVMGQLIAAHRKLCRHKVGHASLLGWLASYQGSNSVKENRWCTPSDGAWSVIKYRDQLVREVARRPQEIQALENAIAQQATVRAKLADSRDEASAPAPVEHKPDTPRGG